LTEFDEYLSKKKDISETSKLFRPFLKNNLKDVRNFEEYMQRFVFSKRFAIIQYLYNSQ